MRATNEQYAIIGRRINMLYHLHIVKREIVKVSKLWDEIVNELKK